jgi:RNA polymerase sigma factor (sigma-70 family)
MLDDSALLRRYAASHTEEDFAEVVRRHVNLVYSAALRQVNGDAHLAQDVTQAVFTDLARKAESVARHRVLAGWLFTSTRFAAAKAVRGEQRRHAREQAAHLMQELNRDPAAQLDWARVRPVLDEVLGELGDADREAILLRFFENRDFASVGERLHVNDNTARMRVERALDKLRAQLARRGVTSTSAALAAALANQAVIAAPAGFAAVVTGAALAGGGTAATAGAAAGGGGLIATFMSMTKLQVGITSALAIAGATGLALQAQSNTQLRDEAAALRKENAALAQAKAENDQIKRTAAEVAELKLDDAELKRLNDEAVALKGRLQKVAAAEQARAAAAPGGEVYDISKLDQTPRVKTQARPQYPFELRRAGIGGQVLVDFVVDKDGNVQNAKALKSSVADKTGAVVTMETFTVTAEGGATTVVATAEALRQFEDAAVAAVNEWKFAAGRKGGREVGTHMQVPIVFALSSNAGGSAPKK